MPVKKSSITSRDLQLTTKARFRSKTEYFSETFTGLNQASQVLSSIEFDECIFTDCDFSGVTFSTCKFSDCSFKKCNLSIVNFNSSKFSSVDFDACKMIGVDWTKAAWPLLALSSPVSFKNSSISDSSFFALNLDKIQMIECEAHDADFREANLTGAGFTETDFLNSLFRNTNLTGADFVDAVNYDIDIHVNKIKNARFSRFEAIRLLNCLGIDLVDN